MKRRNLPSRLYVERWPEEMQRPDEVHFIPTGYGVDWASGKTSRIVVYERVPAPPRKKGKACAESSLTAWGARLVEKQARKSRPRAGRKAKR